MNKTLNISMGPSILEAIFMVPFSASTVLKLHENTIINQNISRRGDIGVFG